jgi:hypothetical protein
MLPRHPVHHLLLPHLLAGAGVNLQQLSDHADHVDSDIGFILAIAVVCGVQPLRVSASLRKQIRTAAASSPARECVQAWPEIA